MLQCHRSVEVTYSVCEQSQLLRRLRRLGLPCVPTTGNTGASASAEVMTVDPQKAEGRLWTLWAAFAKAIGEGSHAGRGGLPLQGRRVAYFSQGWSGERVFGKQMGRWID